MFIKIYRFLLRMWGTRNANCDSFLLRCAIVWTTTYRHCWNYNNLAHDISIGRIPKSPWSHRDFKSPWGN